MITCSPRRPAAGRGDRRIGQPRWLPGPRLRSGRHTQPARPPRRSATVPDVDERTPGAAPPVPPPGPAGPGSPGTQHRPATLDGPAAPSLPGSVLAALDELVTEFHRAGEQIGRAYGVVARAAAQERR